MLMAEEDLQRSEGETLSEEFERIGGKVAAELDQIHKEHPFMYYIHYLEYDRRMDRWIDRQELLLEKELEVMSIPQDSITKRSDIQIGGEHSSSDDHGGGGYGHGNDHGHDELTKMKNIETIVIGQYEMEAWYFSPFPAEVCRYNRLTFCEFCLSFFGHDEELVRHMRKCMIRHPPGHEIYRSKEQNVTIAVFEVDGAKEQIYCQNISLISKLFLDHKTLYYDTKIFLFYVLCEVYDDGYRFVAYFSKEKDPEGHQNNLACILTLPCHQRKGYGHFMISMSYELSKIENKPGSPEKPLSDLGRVSYYSYWAQSLLRVLVDRGHDNSISIEELSKTTAILPQDIFCVLEEINVLKHDGAVHTFEITDEHIARYLKVKKPNIGKDRVYVRPCLPEKLIWVPYMSPFQYKQKRASRFS